MTYYRYNPITRILTAAEIAANYAVDKDSEFPEIPSPPSPLW